MQRLLLAGLLAITLTTSIRVQAKNTWTLGQWTVEMGELEIEWLDGTEKEKRCWVHGNYTKATKSLPSPYTDVEQWIGIVITQSSQVVDIYTGPTKHLRYKNQKLVTPDIYETTKRITFDKEKPSKEYRFLRFKVYSETLERMAIIYPETLELTATEEFLDRALSSKTMQTEQEFSSNVKASYQLDLTDLEKAYNLCRESLGLESYKATKAKQTDSNTQTKEQK